MRWPRVLSFLLLVSGAAGCKQSGLDGGQRSEAPAAPSSPMVSNVTLYSDKPLPRLMTLKLWLGPKELTAEVAIAARELATGMMHRTEMGENEGMLFVLPVPQRAAFYMKNTRVPLSAAYIDLDGAILEIYDLEPFNERPVPSKSDQIHFVLETKQGWFERNQILVGTVIRTEHGSMRETFAKRREPLRTSDR